MLKRAFSLFILIIALQSLCAESWIKADYLYVGNGFNLVYFPTEENLLLAFRQGYTPYASATIRFYKNGKLFSSNKTDKNGLLVLTRFDDDSLTFSVGNDKRRHFITFAKRHPFDYKVRCFAEYNDKNIGLKGYIVGNGIPSSIVIELHDIHGKLLRKNAGAVTGGVFRADISDIASFSSFLVQCDGVSVARYLYVPEGYEMERRELADLYTVGTMSISAGDGEHFLLAPSDHGKLDTLICDFNGEDSLVDTILTPDQGGVTKIKLPDIGRYASLAGNVEQVYADGRSIKQSISLPYLPSRTMEHTYRYYVSENNFHDNSFIVVSDEDLPGSAVIFYDAWVKEIRYISIVKGINKIEIPAYLLDKPIFSVAVIGGSVDNGNNRGIQCTFFTGADKKSAAFLYGYTTGADPDIPLMILGTEDGFASNRGALRDKELSIDAALPSLGGENNDVPAMIKINNMTKTVRKIQVDALDPSGNSISIAAFPSDPNGEKKFYVRIPIYDGYSANVVARDEMGTGYLIPSKKIETAEKYYRTIDVSGVLIGDRTTDVALTVPGDVHSSEIRALFATDLRATVISQAYRERCGADLIFEEALARFVMQQLEGTEVYYPEFLKQFAADDGGIKRFACDDNGNLDATLLYLYAVAKDDWLFDDALVKNARNFVENRAGECNANLFRSRIAKMLQFINEDNPAVKKYYYAGTEVEPDLFDFPQTPYLSSTVSHIRRILVGLMVVQNGEKAGKSISYSIENSFSGKAAGNISPGEIGMINLAFSEDLSALLSDNTVRFTVSKEGDNTLVYAISALFYSTATAAPVISALEPDTGTPVSGILQKGQNYVVQIRLSDATQREDAFMQLRGDIISSVNCIGIKTEGKTCFLKPDALIHIGGQKVIEIEIRPEIDIHIEKIKTLVVPLVKGAS